MKRNFVLSLPKSLKGKILQAVGTSGIKIFVSRELGNMERNVRPGWTQLPRLLLPENSRSA